MVGLIALLAASSAWQPALHAASRTSLAGLALRSTCVQLNDRLTPQQKKAEQERRQALIEAANSKLEQLNEVEKLAPTSWADLGVPKEAEPDLGVSSLLSTAPLVLGVFSIGLFLLNSFGAFGEGPDLDALVEEWSKLE